MNDPLRPTHGCPKCGNLTGFATGHPVYIYGTFHDRDYDIPGDRDRWTNEHLAWSCTTCGYTVATLTADAKALA